jgi:hypothetical protein
MSRILPFICPTDPICSPRSSFARVVRISDELSEEAKDKVELSHLPQMLPLIVLLGWWWPFLLR